MDSTFSGSSLQGPPGPPKVITENESRSAPMDAFGQIAFGRNAWNLLLRYEGDDNVDRYFCRIGDSKSKDLFRYRIINSYACQCAAGIYYDVSMEKFLPAVAFDAKSKTSVAVRRKIIEHAPSGEPIYPTFSIALCEFPDNFHPDVWMSTSEWAAVKSELAPIIARERAMKQSERSILAETAARRMEATRAAENPQAYLGAAIAQGVAMAIREMGLGKKGKE